MLAYAVVVPFHQPTVFWTYLPYSSGESKATLTRLTDSVRCDVLSQSSP